MGVRSHSKKRIIYCAMKTQKVKCRYKFLQFQFLIMKGNNIGVDLKM